MSELKQPFTISEYEDYMDQVGRELTTKINKVVCTKWLAPNEYLSGTGDVLIVGRDVYSKLQIEKMLNPEAKLFDVLLTDMEWDRGDWLQ